jgi:hypothetical protein
MKKLYTMSYQEGYEEGVIALSERTRTTQGLKEAIRDFALHDQDDWDRGYTQAFKDELERRKPEGEAQ